MGICHGLEIPVDSGFELRCLDNKKMTWTLPLPTRLLTRKSLVVELVLSCGGVTRGVCSRCYARFLPPLPARWPRPEAFALRPALSLLTSRFSLVRDALPASFPPSRFPGARWNFPRVALADPPPRPLRGRAPLLPPVCSPSRSSDLPRRLSRPTGALSPSLLSPQGCLKAAYTLRGTPQVAGACTASWLEKPTHLECEGLAVPPPRPPDFQHR